MLRLLIVECNVIIRIDLCMSVDESGYYRCELVSLWLVVVGSLVKSLCLMDRGAGLMDSVASKINATPALPHQVKEQRSTTAWGTATQSKVLWTLCVSHTTSSRRGM